MTEHFDRSLADEELQEELRDLLSVTLADRPSNWRSP
jgi:hypothetical protein